MENKITLKGIMEMALNAAIARNDWKVIAELTMALSDPDRQVILENTSYQLTSQPVATPPSEPQMPDYYGG